MVSDGQLRVGMKFETVASACRKVADTERGIGGKVTTRNAKTIGGFYGEKSGNQVVFSESDNGKTTSYGATIGGRTYCGKVQNSHLKNKDELMSQPFTRIYNSERTQYAEDKNHNGIIDKGEIFDCLW